MRFHSYSVAFVLRYLLRETIYLTEDLLSFESKDILFSKIGSIRKIKLYRDSNGIKKGDALVTYFKPEIVLVAVRQVFFSETFTCSVRLLLLISYLLGILCSFITWISATVV